METNSMVVRTWDDLVFENRNKDYGAYLLRKAYLQRLSLGLAITIAVVALLLILPDYFPASKLAVEIRKPDEGVVVTPKTFIQEQKPKESVQPKKTNRAHRQVLVTRDPVSEVEEQEPVEYTTDHGTDNGNPGIPEGVGQIPAVETSPVAIPKFFEIVEVMPVYEGGPEAMMKFIQKKIRFPRVPRTLGIGGKVYVRFIVNGDGSVSDVEVIRGVHPDYDKEAIRVISMLPSWKGGIHNGRPVKVRMVVPINFNVRN